MSNNQIYSKCQFKMYVRKNFLSSCDKLNVGLRIYY